MRSLLRQAIGYAGASLCALMVDMGVLWSLVRFFSWPPLWAAAVSFVAGACVAYVLSIRFAFKEHRLQSRSGEFAGFLAIGTVGLAVNAGIMAVAVRLLGLHYIMAKCVAAGFTFSCNFAARRQMLFVRRSAVSE